MFQSIFTALLTCMLLYRKWMQVDCACVETSNHKSITCSDRNASFTECALTKNVALLPKLLDVSEGTRDCTLLLKGGYSLGVLDSLSFAGLELIRLEIHNLEIKELRTGAFQLLDPVLRTLTISDTNLKDVLPSTFSGLNSLRKLYLQSNIISSFSAGSLQDLEKLKELFLDSNQIREFPRTLFNPLLSLVTLSLNGNQLSEIHADDFVGLTRLENLFVSANRLTSVSSGAFASLPTLTKLDLSHNLIASLPRTIFQGVPNLEVLNLSGNQLSSLARDVFAGLESLSAVYLDGNELPEVPELESMWSLKQLNMANNRLGFIDVKTFSGCPNLEHLELANNSIRYLNDGTLAMPHLTYLDLSYNKLGMLSNELLSSMNSLNYLHLDGNDLDFEQNSLGGGGGPFRNQERITTLDLFNNSITFLPMGLFSGGSAKTVIILDLSHNRIHGGDRSAFENVELIYVCRLHHNLLTHMGADFFGNAFIVELYLSHNDIHVIETGALRSPTYVMLHSNRLTRVSRGVFNDHNRVINLADNNISSIETGAFRNMKSVYVNLKYNQLTSVSISQLGGGTAELGSFDLRGNPLRCFWNSPPDVTSCGARCVCLPDVSLVCDCRLAWMQRVQEETECLTCSSQCRGEAVPTCRNLPGLPINNYSFYGCSRKEIRDQTCPEYIPPPATTATTSTSLASATSTGEEHNGTLLDDDSSSTGAVAGGATAAAVVLVIVVATGLVWKLRRRQRWRRAKRSQVTTSTSVSTSEDLAGSNADSLDVIPMDDCPSPGSVELGTRRAYKMGRF